MFIIYGIMQSVHFCIFFAAKGAYNAHAEKRIEELQAKVREMERQNGQMKEKVSLSLNFL